MTHVSVSLLTGLLFIVCDVSGTKSKGDDIIIIGAGGGSSSGGSPLILDQGGGKGFGKKGSSTIIILPPQKSSHPQSNHHVHSAPMSYPLPQHTYHPMDSIYGSASFQSMHPAPNPFFGAYPMQTYRYPSMNIKANVNSRSKRKKRKSKAKIPGDFTMKPPSMTQSGSYNMMSMRPSMMNNMGMQLYSDSGNNNNNNDMNSGYGGNNMGNTMEMKQFPQIIIKVPAPIVNVPQPIVNVPPAIVNVSAPIVNVPPVTVPTPVVEVPTPVVNVPTPVVNVDVPNIKVPPAIVKVPKKLILRKEVKVRSGTMHEESGSGYGSDMADSGKINFEEEVDHEYKSSSNKNEGQQTTVTYNDDDEYDLQQPVMKLPPRTPIPRPKTQRLQPSAAPLINTQPYVHPTRPMNQQHYSPSPSHSVHFSGPEIHYDSRQRDPLQHPRYNQPQSQQPVHFRQSHGQLLKLTIPVPVISQQYRQQSPTQSFSNSNSNNNFESLQNLPDPQPYFSPPPSPQYTTQRFDYTDSYSKDQTNYPLTDSQVMQLMRTTSLPPLTSSQVTDSNLHVLSDDQREPNIIFEKTEPPVDPGTSFFNDQFNAASTDTGQSTSEPSDSSSEDQGQGFYRDHRDGIIFEELPSSTKKPTKKLKKDLMLYQDQTDAPVYTQPNLDTNESEKTHEFDIQDEVNENVYEDQVDDKQIWRKKRRTGKSECSSKDT